MTDFSVPRLGELQPTPSSVIEARADGLEVAEHLATMGLHAFSDRRGDIWLGLVGDDIHEHDRWLYRIPNLVGNDPWDELPYEMLLHCEHAHVPVDAGILMELQSMVMIFEGAAERLPAAQQQPRPELARHYLLAFQRFGWLATGKMRQILAAPWGADLHDILEHHEVWAKRNRTDMPRELALRMYGLGAYVDALIAGDEADWLNGN